MQISRREFTKGILTTGCGALASLPTSNLWADDAPPIRTVNDDIRAAAEQVELSMQFRGTTADECIEWQAGFRKKMHELLGDITPPKQWRPTERSKKIFDDHIRYEFLLVSKNTPSLPVYLLVPKDVSADKPAPGVLCVHGHGSHGHHPIVGRTDLPGVGNAIKSANYDYGLQFVRRGYVVAAPCMVPFGDRVNRERYGGSDPCAVAFVRMQAYGQLPIAANLRDLRWSLDLLQSRAEVKKDKLGCAGLSYGGRMTMLVSGMDQRIRVTAISGALNLLQERISLRYSCGSQVIPHLLKYGDYSEIGSLIAPRPCVWEMGSNDGLIVPKWSDLFRKRLQKAYRAYGADQHLRFDEFQGGHRWNGDVAFPLFKKVLES